MITILKFKKITNGPQWVSYLSGCGQALHKGRSDVACHDPAHQGREQTPVTVVAQSILHQGEHVEQRVEALKNTINELFKNISNYLTTMEDSGKTQISVISPPAVTIPGCALQPNVTSSAPPGVSFLWLYEDLHLADYGYWIRHC